MCIFKLIVKKRGSYPAGAPSYVIVVLCLFAGDDSIVGANAGASAAVNAGIGINYIDIALRNRIGRALGETCAASYAAVSNYVCHNCLV